MNKSSLKNLIIKSSLILLILGSLIFSSCRTLPPPASNDDTMLIIPMGIEKRGAADWFGKYRIHVTSNSSGEIVKTHLMPISSGYTLIKGLKPGEYRITRDEFIYNSNRSPGSHVNRSYYFELFPGKITVLHKRFVYTFLPNSSGGSVMNRRWDSFTKKDQEELLYSFKEYKNYDLWDSEP